MVRLHFHSKPPCRYFGEMSEIDFDYAAFWANSNRLLSRPTTTTTPAAIVSPLTRLQNLDTRQEKLNERQAKFDLEQESLNKQMQEVCDELGQTNSNPPQVLTLTRALNQIEQLNRELLTAKQQILELTQQNKKVLDLYFGGEGDDDDENEKMPELISEWSFGEA